AAAQLEVAGGLVGRLAVDEEADEDARAGAGEAERDGAPDPASPSRDQDLAPRRAQGAIPLAAGARSSGDRRSSRASVASRAALANASVPGRAGSRAYSSVADATRRPSTSAVAARPTRVGSRYSRSPRAR